MPNSFLGKPSSLFLAMKTKWSLEHCIHLLTPSRALVSVGSHWLNVTCCAWCVLTSYIELHPFSIARGGGCRVHQPSRDDAGWRGCRRPPWRPSISGLLLDHFHWPLESILTLFTPTLKQPVTWSYTERHVLWFFTITRFTAWSATASCRPELSVFDVKRLWKVFISGSDVRRMQ